MLEMLRMGVTAIRDFFVNFYHSEIEAIDNFYRVYR